MMDAETHYQVAEGMLKMIVEHKDDPDFTLANANTLLFTAQTNALMGILRFAIDERGAK